MTIDMPTVRRYLRALDQLMQMPGFSSYARQAFLDMLTPGVDPNEYIEPVATLPESKLTFEERAWRRVAQAASCLA